MKRWEIGIECLDVRGRLMTFLLFWVLFFIVSCYVALVKRGRKEGQGRQGEVSFVATCAYLDSTYLPT